MAIASFNDACGDETCSVTLLKNSIKPLDAEPFVEGADPLCSGGGFGWMTVVLPAAPELAVIIENELQGVNAQINEIQSQILQTRTLIDYSTITVTLNRVNTITPKPLTLKLIATPQSGMAPLAVTFNSLVSGGSGPYIVNYNFGDGTSYQGQTLIHTFNQGGAFNVTVTVTDSNGTVNEAWTVIHVSSASSHSLKNFYDFVGGLLVAVVEGIVEVAVVVLPIALVVGLVILPFRNRLQTKKSCNTEADSYAQSYCYC